MAKSPRRQRVKADSPTVNAGAASDDSSTSSAEAVAEEDAATMAEDLLSSASAHTPTPPPNDIPATDTAQNTIEGKHTMSPPTKSPPPPPATVPQIPSQGPIELSQTGRMPYAERKRRALEYATGKSSTDSTKSPPPPPKTLVPIPKQDPVAFEKRRRRALIAAYGASHKAVKHLVKKKEPVRKPKTKEARDRQTGRTPTGGYIRSCICLNPQECRKLMWKWSEIGNDKNGINMTYYLCLPKETSKDTPNAKHINAFRRRCFQHLYGDEEKPSGIKFAREPRIAIIHFPPEFRAELVESEKKKSKIEKWRISIEKGDQAALSDMDRCPPAKGCEDAYFTVPSYRFSQSSSEMNQAIVNRLKEEAGAGAAAAEVTITRLREIVWDKEAAKQSKEKKADGAPNSIIRSGTLNKRKFEPYIPSVPRRTSQRSSKERAHDALVKGIKDDPEKFALLFKEMQDELNAAAKLIKELKEKNARYLELDLSEEEEEEDDTLYPMTVKR